MTLLDHLAQKAMRSLIIANPHLNAETIAFRSYEIAFEMIKAKSELEQLFIKNPKKSP